MDVTVEANIPKGYIVQSEGQRRSVGISCSCSTDRATAASWHPAGFNTRQNCFHVNVDPSKFGFPFELNAAKASTRYLSLPQNSVAFGESCSTTLILSLGGITRPTFNLPSSSCLTLYSQKWIGRCRTFYSTGREATSPNLAGVARLQT
jgi:hypothetical protein